MLGFVVRHGDASVTDQPFGAEGQTDIKRSYEMLRSGSRI